LAARRQCDQYRHDRAERLRRWDTADLTPWDAPLNARRRAGASRPAQLHHFCRINVVEIGDRRRHAQSRGCGAGVSGLADKAITSGDLDIEIKVSV
jgi:hypothetical protein